MDSQHQDHQQPQQPQQQQQQEPQQEQQQQHQQQQQHHQTQGRGSKKVGRPRGSSRAGRHSSSSGNHHSYDDSHASSSSLTNSLTFQVESPTGIHTRTPTTTRGRGKNTPSQHRFYKYASSSPASTDISSSATPNMEPTPRAEKAPKQGLGHSFTFSTPQPNPRQTPGRRRARTLDYPTDSAAATAADEEAAVKGGHSLRKRARIDYAQMNDDDAADVYIQPSDAPPLEITVSGARAARKRQPVIDTSFEQQEESQPQSATGPTKKRARNDTQRTASPVPARRPYTKRKSTASAAPVENPSPEQQPSDTELKDTIEVGGVAMGFPSSSSSTSQPSETASNNSGESPSRNGNAQHAILSQPQVTSPMTMQSEMETPANHTKSEGSVHLDQSNTPLASPLAPRSPASVDNPKMRVNGQETQVEDQSNQLPDHNSTTLGEPAHSTDPIVPTTTKSEADNNQSPQLRENSQGFQDTKGPIDAANNVPSAAQPSSQNSTDSDATEVIPAGDLLPKEVTSASPKMDQPTPAQHSRVTLTRKSKQAPTESPQQDGMDGSQDAQKPSLRPRRRLNRVAEDSVVADEEPASSTTDTPASSKKPDGRFKAANRAAPAQDTPTPPLNLEGPKKRGPGRPPKIRQSIEQQEPLKPKAPKGSSRLANLVEQPRPVRSYPPRDFSFLTPYQEIRDYYPEISQDSGTPTPLETPNFQPSDGADGPAEDLGSMAPDKEPGLEGELGSNAPTPTPMSDLPSPAAESAATSRAGSPEPVIEPMRKPRPPPPEQYGFRRIRSPSQFTNILDTHKNMSDEELFNILATANNALVAWQDEWKRQKIITDDEDNAVRRRAHDAAQAAREARDLAKAKGSVTVEKRDFEVKGIRAEKTNEKKHNYPYIHPEAYERHQDQVAAQAWGFEWDPRPSMIGKQDPILQRDGLQNTRLRNRPKPSQRLAEAIDEHPASFSLGKRTRRPARLLSDESKEPSRAPTPVEQPTTNPRKRRRRRNLDGEFESDNEGAAQQQQPEALPEPALVPEPPPKKKRGPKPKAVKEAEARAAAEREAAEKAAREAAAAVAAEVAPNDVGGVERTQTQTQTRKRRRVAAAAAAAAPEIAPQDVPAASIEDAQPQRPANSQIKQEEGPPPKKRRGRKPKAEIPPTTFYGATSNAQTNDHTIVPTEEKRPSTSSSTSSERTVGSSYSFRNRTRKNYSELADPINQVLAEQPRPKRGRKPKNRQEDPVPTSYPSNLAPAPYNNENLQYPPPSHGYQPLAASVLAPPDNPFINVTGGGPVPGPLLAPSPVRPGHVAAPSSVGANPFSTPNNHPVEPTPLRPQSPTRRKVFKIKLNTNRGKQSATPQPAGPPPGSAPLQHPNNFHGFTYEANSLNDPQPLAADRPRLGQVMFPVNAFPGSMSMPSMLQNAPPLPALGTIAGRHGSLPPDGRGTSVSGRGTPVPSSSASVNGAMGADLDDLSEKDYASMTKSEKMSASMKARWANGSMRQAVNKRKETLARKKQKVSDDKTTTPTPQPESAPPSADSQAATTPPALPPPAAVVPEAVGPAALLSQQQPPPPPRAYDGILHSFNPEGAAPGPHGGAVLPSPSAMVGPGPAAPQFHAPDFRSPQPRSDPQEQNPFLDNGYADLHPRLPFSNGELDMRNGRYERGRWGPGPQ